MMPSAPLAPHVVPKEQEQHLHHDHRINRDVPLAPVATRYLFAHEIQLEDLSRSLRNG